MAEQHETHAGAGPPGGRGEVSLIGSAARWMDEALKAWADDDYAKVAALAPLAVEHLGKAVLWRQNPVLLVPLTQDAEPSLISLATKPSLSSPKLRTVGLAALLRRLERLLGALPVDAAQRTRMVEIRNGAMHVGSPAQSRHVLLDALTLCNLMLTHLSEDAATFFGDHHASVRTLLDQKRTEVGHRIAAKRARARRHLSELEERLGEDLFTETTARLEEQAPFVLDPDDFGTGLHAVDAACPECGSKSRLFGRVDVSPEVDFDVEPLGGGQYDAVPHGYWALTLAPQAFACSVCLLTLHGPDELAECGLPASLHEISPEDLGEDFDPQAFAEAEYGLDD